MKRLGKKSIWYIVGWLVIVGGMIPRIGEAQNTTRVSVSTGGGQGNGEADEFSLSADGRFVVFESLATNLVPGDTNGVSDIFLHDRQTGQTTRISVATGGAQGNGPSNQETEISADGRVVVFHSEATNLVVGDINGEEDVFVHDRQTGITTLVSVATGGGQSNSWSENSTISADGRIVAFESGASNLVLMDTNGQPDVFVHDRQTGETTRISVTSGGEQGVGGGFNSEGSGNPRLSANGRFVSFKSWFTNLVPGDTNGQPDIFIHDRQTGETTRVSVGTGGLQANGPSEEGQSRLSADGRFVAFASEATNLVSGDTNGVSDIFVHDRQTRETTRVSVSTGGGQANGPSDEGPDISGDGRYVTFESSATNLVSGDTNGVSDIFVHDRQTGETIRVSITHSGGQANSGSAEPTLSLDGRFMAFVSDATNLIAGDTNGVADIFIHDRGAVLGNLADSDLDGDGKADIVWRNTSSGIVAVWLMDGTTIADSGFPAGVPFAWQIARIGDIDGDNRADVIWRNDTSGTVAVWLMNGFTITSVGFPGSTSTDWEIQQVGDVDGNGTADLIWQNTNSDIVAVWLMNGTAILSSGFLGGVPAAWKMSGIGDVNADGRMDVIWRNDTSGTVAVWLMNGLSITSVGFPGSTSTDWMIADMGDVDGNGMADVVWRNTSSGAVALWLLNGTVISSSGFLPGKADEWMIAQVGDTDGDGKADVIWRNTSTGQIEVWLMNGLAIASTGSPGTTSIDWEIQGGGTSKPMGVPSNSPTIPTITGVYSGNATATNTNCSDSDINTNFTADVQVIILTQSGNTFTGEASVELAFDGNVFLGMDQLAGMVSSTGDITGTIVGQFEATRHAGTLSGHVGGNTLSYAFSTQDTFGETCHTTGTVTATK